MSPANTHWCRTVPWVEIEGSCNPWSTIFLTTWVRPWLIAMMSGDCISAFNVWPHLGLASNSFSATCDILCNTASCNGVLPVLFATAIGPCRQVVHYSVQRPTKFVVGWWMQNITESTFLPYMHESFLWIFCYRCNIICITESSNRWSNPLWCSPHHHRMLQIRNKIHFQGYARVIVS